jgi:Kinesin motor domain
MANSCNVSTSMGEAIDISNSDRVRVAVRCRSPLASESVGNPAVHCIDDESISVQTALGRPTRDFKFDFVSDNTCTQEMMFEQAGRPVVECAMSGFNGTIFAYGQTGSGKTYTMTGPTAATCKDAVDERGVVPRACEAIFEHVAAYTSAEVTFKVSASYLEIYNEKIRDLLVDQKQQQREQRERMERTSASSVKLPVRVMCNKGIYLRETASGEILVEGGRLWIDVTNERECIKAMLKGSASRTVGKTAMNCESSRSHAIFTIAITQTSTVTMKQRVSQLHLVDLAGSERQKSTQATGERLKESNEINKSLTSLGNVIQALVDVATMKGNSNRHIPYRDSKLTFLLKDALGGNSKTCLIATVSPSKSSLSETWSTLEFAKRCSAIKNVATINEDLTSDIKELQDEVRRLRTMVKRLEIKNASMVSRSGSCHLTNNGCSMPSSPSRGNDNDESLHIREELGNEKSLAEEEAKRADEEALRANEEAKRADMEAIRADQLEKKAAEEFERANKAEMRASKETELASAEASRAERLQMIAADALSREETGKKIMRQATKRNDEFAELVERQEKTISAVRDVVQLRDTALKEFHTKTWSKDSAIRRLRQEIELIKIQRDNHPEIARLSMELSKSKANLKSLDKCFMEKKTQEQRSLQDQLDLLTKELETSLVENGALRGMNTPRSGQGHLSFEIHDKTGHHADIGDKNRRIVEGSDANLYNRVRSQRVTLSKINVIDMGLGSRLTAPECTPVSSALRVVKMDANLTDIDIPPAKTAARRPQRFLSREESETRTSKLCELLTSLRESVSHLEESISSATGPTSLVGRTTLSVL